MTPRVPLPDAVTKRWPGLYDAANHENDAFCAIVLTSYVEHVVRALLRTRFVNGDTAKHLIDPQGGALGLLHNATALAYVIGEISAPCRDTIDNIGTIRNRFAHSIDHVSFERADIVELCNKLVVPLPDDVVVMSADPGLTAEAIREMTVAGARWRFILAAVTVCNLLILKAIGAAHIDKCRDAWGS